MSGSFAAVSVPLPFLVVVVVIITSVCFVSYDNQLGDCVWGWQSAGNPRHVSLRTSHQPHHDSEVLMRIIHQKQESIGQQKKTRFLIHHWFWFVYFLETRVAPFDLINEPKMLSRTWCNWMSCKTRVQSTVIFNHLYSSPAVAHCDPHTWKKNKAVAFCVF